MWLNCRNVCSAGRDDDHAALCPALRSYLLSVANCWATLDRTHPGLRAIRAQGVFGVSFCPIPSVSFLGSWDAREIGENRTRCGSPSCSCRSNSRSSRNPRPRTGRRREPRGAVRRVRDVTAPKKHTQNTHTHKHLCMQSSGVHRCIH